MGDSSASYIHMVQHLIEKCLIFHMTKEECMEALSKHAKIDPVITSTVWKELEKENKEFFASYVTSKSQESSDRMSEAETSELIHKIISADSSSKDSNDLNQLSFSSNPSIPSPKTWELDQSKKEKRKKNIT